MSHSLAYLCFVLILVYDISSPTFGCTHLYTLWCYCSCAGKYILFPTLCVWRSILIRSCDVQTWVWLTSVQVTFMRMQEWMEGVISSTSAARQMVDGVAILSACALCARRQVTWHESACCGRQAVSLYSYSFCIGYIQRCMSFRRPTVVLSVLLSTSLWSLPHSISFLPWPFNAHLSLLCGKSGKKSHFCDN